MITTAITFFLNAILFFILSFFIKNVFSYYVLASLLIMIGWLRIADSGNNNIARGLLEKHPDLFSDEEQEQIFLNSPSIFLIQLELKTALTRNDFSATIFYAILISLLNVIICAVRQDWISLLISVAIVLYLIFGKIRSAFPGSIDQDNFLKVIDRYLKTKKLKKKDVTEMELRLLSSNYNQILSKLEGLR